MPALPDHSQTLGSYSPGQGGARGLLDPLCPAGVGEQRSRQITSSQFIGPPQFLLASSGVAATQPERLDAGDERCKVIRVGLRRLPCSSLPSGWAAVSQALFVLGIRGQCFLIVLLL